jgi:hypothetical protein
MSVVRHGRLNTARRTGCRLMHMRTAITNRARFWGRSVLTGLDELGAFWNHNRVVGGVALLGFLGITLGPPLFGFAWNSTAGLAVAVIALTLVWMNGAYVESRKRSFSSAEPLKVTPRQAGGRKPMAHGDTTSEIIAYLDIETTDENAPLRNCRVKLLELEHHTAWTQEGEVKERWDRDSFYAGQTYFFSWSGRASSIEAVDIYKKERAVIARCVGTRPELTTTQGAVGHLFHGDRYHLTVEITTDDSLPITREYCLQMHQGRDLPVIQEWDAGQTSWL